jgi:glyoxylase-like metal-dependent hydrolase (beta-lactamase superfamily II)
MELIPLQVPFPREWGRGDATNIYLIKDERTVLVDTGFNSPSNREYMEEAMKKLTSWRIDAILLTHGHMDHFGMAGYIQRESGARLYIHEEDSAALEDYRKALAWLDEAWVHALEAGFSMDEMDDARLKLLAALDLMTKPESYTPFRELELDIGGSKITTIHIPGHTSGCVGYVMGDSVFSGDVALDGSTVVGDLKKEFVAIQKLKLFRQIHTGHKRTPLAPSDLDRLEAHFSRRLDEVLRRCRVGKTLKELVHEIYPMISGSDVNFIKKVIPIRQVISYLKYLEEEGYMAKKGVRWYSFRDHI